MAESQSTSPPGTPIDRDMPHVRLNSSQSNLLANDVLGNQAPTGPNRQKSARSLVPQQRPLAAPSVRSNPTLNRMYNGGPMDSAETLLIPPTRSRTHRFRDEESVPGSPVEGISRRTSFSSDGRGYGRDPFADSRATSRAPSRAGSDDEHVNTQTVSEKYNILPSAGLLLFPEDVEKDDWLHNPDPNEKEPRECNIFTKRGAVNVGGLALVTAGLLVLFIGYPILYETLILRVYGIHADRCVEPSCNDSNLQQMRAPQIQTASILGTYLY